MHNKYVQYRFNRIFFDRLLEERGYRSHVDFCGKNSIHRNTLNYYLSGHDVFSKKIYEIASALDVDPKDLIEPTTQAVPDIDEIVGIINLISNEKGVAAVLLGSRVKGGYREYSDWDIGITRGENPLGGRDLLRIRGSVDDMADNLPRKVDIVNLDAAPLWFLRSIDYSPVFLGGEIGSYQHFKGVLDGIAQCEVEKRT